MKKKMRKAGISIIGDVPWGTHLCQFYRTKEDLLDILVPYFKAGLENNEFCIWITSEPLNQKEVDEALRKAVPDFNLYLQKGQIEIMPHDWWYFKGGIFDLKRALNAWIDKLNQALSRGYDGMRITGNATWLEKRDWKEFQVYEEKVNNAIGEHRMIAICSYSLDKWEAAEIIDVVKNHQSTLIKREDRWDLIDLSECKKSERALREKEERYRELFNHMSSGVSVYEAKDGGDDFLFKDFNRAGEQIEKVKKEKLIGRTIRQVFSGVKDFPLFEVFHRVWKTGKPEHFSSEVYKDQKAVGWRENYIYKLPAGDIVSIFDDVTERKKAEESLRGSEEKFRTIFETANDVIIYVDTHGKILELNRKVEDILGYKPEEVKGKNFASVGVFRLKDAPKILKLFKDAVLKGKVVDTAGKGLNTMELYLRHKSGQEVPVETNTTAVKKNGKLEGFLTILRDITERKKAEEALKQSEQDYRGLFESAHDAIIILNPEGEIILDANQRACEVYGFDRSEFVGMSLHRISKDIPRGERHIRMTLEKGFYHHFETVQYRKDGSEIFLEINASVLDYKGQRAILSINRDITERKKAEEALRASEKRYRLLFERNLAGVYRTTLEGSVLDCNESFAQLLGYDSPEEVKSSNSSKFYFDKNDRKNFSTLLEEQGYLNNFEICLRGKDGNPVWILENVILIKEDANSSPVIQGTSIDITERKKAEEALQESEARYRNLVENSKDSIVIIDLKGKILYSNKASEKLTGYTLEEGIGMNVKDITPARYWPRSLAALMKARSGKPVPYFESAIRRKDGKLVFVETGGQAILKDGKPVGVQIITRDITERKKAEEALQESEKKYRSFVENFQGIAFRGDVNFKVDFFHGSVKEITGYTEEDFKKAKVKWNNIIHPDDLSWILKDVQKTVSNQLSTSEREYRIVDKDGRIHWVRENVQTIFADSGEMTGSQGTIIDITERKRAEEALKESEDKFRTLAESAQCGITILQGEKSIYNNPAVSSFTGYTKQELEHMSFWDLVRPDFKELVKQRGLGRQDGKSVLDRYEIPIIIKNGDERWIDISAGTCELRGKSAVISTALDITERKRAEEALRESEEKYRSLFEGSLHPITIYDCNANIVMLNQIGVENLKKPLTEILGKPLRKFIPETHDLTVKRVRQVLETGKPLFVEDGVSLPQGKRWFLSTLHPVSNPKGKPDLVQVISYDITERKKAEQEIKQQTKRLATINAIASTVNKSLELDQVLQVALEKTIETLELAAGAIYLLDENTEELVMRTHKNLPQQFVKKVARVKLKTAEFFDSPLRTGKVLTVNDLSQHPEISKITDEEWHNSVAIVPLIAKNRVLGNINLLGHPGKLFTSDDIVILIAIGHQIGVAIDNAILYEQAQREITERKKAEESLRESEEKFRTIFESVPISMIMIDKDGLMVEVSPYQVDQIAKGLTSREGYIGKSLITHPTIVNAGLSYTYKRLLKGESFDLKDFYFPSIQRGTEGYYFNIKGIPLFKEGEVIGAITVHEEVTERKRAEEVLRNYQLMVESANDVIFYKDLESRYVIANARTVEAFGLPREEVIGKSDLEIMSNKEEAKENIEDDQTVFKTGKPKEIFKQMTGSDGRKYWFHAIKVPQYDDKGDIIGLVGIARDMTEYKKVEQALRESERKYRNLVQDSLDGICVVQGLEIKFVNQSMLKIFNCQSENEIVGQEFTKFVLPEYRKKMEEMGFARERGENIPQRYEFKGLRKDGTEFNAELSVSKIPYQGNIARQGIIRDITERKQAEEALKESEERYRNLFENAPIGIYRTAPDGRILMANPAIIRMLGYSSFEELASRNLEKEGYKTSYPRSQFKQLIESRGEVNGFEAIWIKSDKSEIFVRENAKVFRDDKGAVLYYEGTAEDITQRKMAEEALRESENKYRTLLESIPQKIFFKDKNSVYISCNENYARDLKIRSDEISGKTDYEFYPRELAEKYIVDDKRIMESGKTEDIEEEYVQDGREMIVHTIKTPVKNEKGNVLGILGIFWDVTEKRKLQQQLIQSEKLAAVGTLAYGIAHEFNNILAGVMSSAEFGSTTSDPELIKESFNLIAENTERASSITSNLLSFARQKDARKEMNDITQPLKGVLSLTRRELEKANIKIVEEFKPIPKIFCDPGHFSEVFLNLITNARDAMLPDGGTLTLKLDTQNDNIRIRFQDTGCGIPDEIKGRIFEPFVTTKGALGGSEIPGTGLGLFLTYGIIDNYQGKIEVESSVGKGTRFTILLPITKSLPPAGFMKEETESPEEIQKRLNILLVDDERSICVTTKRFLESKGHQIITSLRAVEGIEYFRKGKFDVILSDITIPDMDGIELIKRIRKEDQTIKIIVMTGHIQTQKEREAKEAGANAVLVKPFKNEMLYRTISRVLSG